MKASARREMAPRPKTTPDQVDAALLRALLAENARLRKLRELVMAYRDRCYDRREDAGALMHARNELFLALESPS